MKRTVVCPPPIWLVCVVIVSILVGSWLPNKAKAFYAETLELKVEDEGVGLSLHVPGDCSVFMYPRDDHQSATFTILNFEVGNIREKDARWMKNHEKHC